MQCVLDHVGVFTVCDYCNNIYDNHTILYNIIIIN